MKDPSNTSGADDSARRPRIIMKLVAPESSDPSNWISKCLEFIESNYQGCGLHPGLLEKLKALNAKGKISLKALGPKRLGSYNRLTDRMVVNSGKFLFLCHDFRKQIEVLNKTGDLRRVEQAREQHARAILELSGVLIHEGAHAFNRIWNPEADENSAFTTEQTWYRHLHNLDSKYGEHVASLSRDAEEDGKTSLIYKKMKLDARSQIQGG